MGTQASSLQLCTYEDRTVEHLLLCVMTENVGFSTVHFVVTVVSQLDGEIQITHSKPVCKEEMYCNVNIVHSTP